MLGVPERNRINHTQLKRPIREVGGQYIQEKILTCETLGTQNSRLTLADIQDAAVRGEDIFIRRLARTG